MACGNYSHSIEPSQINQTTGEAKPVSRKQKSDDRVWTDLLKVGYVTEEGNIFSAISE